jgi:uncharacterized protein YciI
METRQVVFHSPGPKWKPGFNFRDQQEDLVMAHVQHYAKFHEQGKLLHGGPFIDIDSGGMMVTTKEVTREELDGFAASDPAVNAGLLVFEIKTWYVAMSHEAQKK